MRVRVRIRSGLGVGLALRLELRLGLGLGLGLGALARTLSRLPLINTPLLLLNAYDDPIVPGASLVDAIAHARVNEHIVMALTSHGSGSG